MKSAAPHRSHGRAPAAAPARARVRPVPDHGAAGRSGRRWLRLGTVVLSLLSLLLLFGLVAFNALLVRQQGRLDDLDRELREATRANQQLRFEVAELEAPERIRTQAIEVLGMVEPEVVVYLEPIEAADLAPASAPPATDTETP